MEVIRRISFYGNYFRNFYEQQEQKVRDKIDYILDLVANVAIVPAKFLKHLAGTDGIYEIRIITATRNIRIFCFFDEDHVIILTNCLIKRTQKTPKRALKLAKRLKQAYFEIKNKRSWRK